MNKNIIAIALVLLTCGSLVHAQREVDPLDRGLIAVKTEQGVFLSWRILGEEYDDVRYDVYRDGIKLNGNPLSVSNYTDSIGTLKDTYTVAPVVNGVEGTQCKKDSVCPENYLEIKKATRISNDGVTDITNEYEPNDATIADVDGDGEMEVIVKMINTADQPTLYPNDGVDYDRIEVYKLNGKLLWWIDCGPNMCDFQHNETNIIAYDWDGDGKAECILRGADGMIIHLADDSTVVIGDKTKNYRSDVAGSTSEYFVHSGNEYLLYLNGETGQPYEVTSYPLKRLEDGETDLAKAWGDGYGHRSTKHFFGAPYLDGRKPSVFLARGIYTRHKMIALDVDSITHTLKTRWTWNCNDSGSKWYGQGYHNYTIADVDGDGRDEICFGSMVIDDNGKGLSTTGLGHGDAQHVGDFNPYIQGEEIVACNETNPDNNYRDATTSKIYYRKTDTSDAGRAIAGNFSNAYPGAQFITAHDDNSLISAVTNQHLDGATGGYVDENFRIYWDGDLEDETFNGMGTRNSEGVIHKYGKGVLETFSGTLTNNDTKATPCFQGDIFGDWREELILRTSDNNMRIYTTTIPTTHRIYTLLDDPQYRNAMVWQMCGYNQPPHPGFFLGDLEDITAAPPAPIMTGRKEVKSGEAITPLLDQQQLILAETNDMTVSVASGASPSIVFDNAPTWVQGNNDNDRIVTTTYTHTLTGSGFRGEMRLVKLGNGTLRLPSVTQQYSGSTEIWAGTLCFDGEMKNSHVWLNRFSALQSKGGIFDKRVMMDYGSVLYPGGKDEEGSVTMDSLVLNFGARITFDLFGNDTTADTLIVQNLEINKKTWNNGPVYSTPVFEIVPHYMDGADRLPEGKYLIGSVDQIEGKLDDVVIEGIGAQKAQLSYDSGKLYIVIEGLRDATAVTWTGKLSNDWDLATTRNFATTESGEDNVFVSGDHVTFDDQAVHTKVNIDCTVYPGQILFSNDTCNYTFSGDSIAGACPITKSGNGKVTFNNVNTFTGNVEIDSGIVEVSSLGCTEGSSVGALGNYKNTLILDHGGMLRITKAINLSHEIRAIDGIVNIPTGTVSMKNAAFTGNGDLTKTGEGQLTLYSGNQIKRFFVNEGTVYDGADGHSLGDSVIFNGNSGILKYNNSIYSYSSATESYRVPKGKTGSIYLDGRCAYYGTLTGEGTLNVHSQYVRNTLQGDWSAFAGTVNAYQDGGTFDFYNAYGLPKATLNIESGCTFKNTSEEKKTAKTYSMQIGALSGSGTLGGSGTYYIGANDSSTLYTGTFGSDVNIVKTGNGKWTLFSTEPDMGTLNIQSGKITLRNNTSETMTGTKAMVVKGKLSGYGHCDNTTVTFQSGSCLSPGVSGAVSYGTLAFGGDLTMQEGSDAVFTIFSSSKYGAISVDGTMSLGGTNAVKFDSSYTPAIGDKFIFWEAGTAKDVPALSLPLLPSSMAWDTTELTGNQGIVKIISAVDEISQIDSDVLLQATVFTVDGRKIKIFRGKKADFDTLKGSLPSGTYLIHFSTESNRFTQKLVIP